VRRLLLLVVASTAQAQPLGSPNAEPIHGWVIDAKGPVAGAELRVVPLAKAPCPCKPKSADDATAFDNSVPECACPEALASYRRRLASCTWPVPARKVMRSDAQGHFSLERAALGSMLEARTRSGVQWLATPPRADRIAVELAAPITRRLRVDAAVDVRAALLYDDGHCVPFRRDGTTNFWATVAPAPARSDDWPVLMVEANGFATIARAWFQSAPDLELSLQPAKPVTGSCSGSRVELDNPFQHLVANIDRAKPFSFTGVLDLDSNVRCLRGGTVVDEWVYSTAEGLQSGGSLGGFGSNDSCHEVRVVDRAGRPIPGAELSFDSTPGANLGTGSSMTYTDERGRTCVGDVHEGGELVAHPPLDRGGWCAGEAKVAVTQRALRKPMRIVLDVRPLRRSRWRGRLSSPERVPIVGSYVAVRDIQPAETSDCSERSDVVVRTGPDGMFELPLLPNGRLKLSVQHDWYAAREIELTLPSPEREIQLDRGLAWTGRVLDPDGKVIDQCRLFLTLSDQRLLTATCSARGFSFGTLVPGTAKLSVRVEKHALGTWRALDRTIEIKPGKSLVDDVRWPGGATIAGRVVDGNGAPIAGARLTALPKGTPEAVNRFAEGEVMLEADQNGRFVFRHLAPGTWTIRGDRRARKQTTLDVEAGGGKVQFVTNR
jgi:hypothetical protein